MSDAFMLPFTRWWEMGKSLGKKARI